MFEKGGVKHPLSHPI